MHNTQTIYRLWLDGKDWGHCYSFQAAYSWKGRHLAAGHDPVGCYITKDRLPLRVPIYGPLQSV